MLKGRHILLGVTGSIAAYKAATLIRLLMKEGALVQVIMTSAAKEFITPLTLATLSKRPILVEFYNPENGDWNSHISLGCWADAYLVAPASANTLAKMAGGIADNLLLTTYLSARCPVMVAPAMDVDMWSHPSTQDNLKILSSRGVEVIEPVAGELASGLEGKGRMEEPEKIVEYLAQYFSTGSPFEGKKILITAGPTREAIDPVRFISNYSSGKMGYELSKAFAKEGADVQLVSGPVSLQIDDPNITIHRVESAREMKEATMDLYSKGADITIFCAAVADFTPSATATSKIKRHDDHLTLELVPTADIAAEIGAHKRKGSILVGFALETDNAVKNAREKLLRKQMDMIVLNSLEHEGAGFGGDTNQITIIDKDGTVTDYPLCSKQQVAKDIVDYLKRLL